MSHEDSARFRTIMSTSQFAVEVGWDNDQPLTSIEVYEEYRRKILLGSKAVSQLAEKVPDSVEPAQDTPPIAA
jgi:hypothetical protein